jgi:iron(III) transport system ATP-binding protein
MVDEQPVVRVRDLVKRFRRADGSVVNAIDHVSFDVLPGQMVVLVGPSGCGKTTLLRSIAGLEHPDQGRIEIHGVSYFSSTDRVNVPPERRKVSMVFQNYALWPHMTAFQNVAYPLRSNRRDRLGRKEVAAKVHQILSLVGIPDLAEQHPHQMSGGQRQRVALARALVAGSDLVLFDEPLSNVDAKVRTKLRLELLSMQRELKFSAVFVTHDQVEAMELAHTIAVMGSGQVQQFGSPQQIYDEPRSRYVANFIGTTNEVVGLVSSVSGNEVRVDSPLGEVVGTLGVDRLDVGDEVTAVWRPERTTLSNSEPPGANRWQGTIRTSMFLGSHTEYAVEVADDLFRVWHPEAVLRDEGATRWVSVDPSNVRVLPAEHGPDAVGDVEPA